MAPLTLVMATRNTGKVREMAELLRDLEVRLLSLADFPEIADIPEEGATFAENATAKAKTVARLTGLPALADDSGLEVEALGGRPGVFSARYAQDRTGGKTPKDADNWQKLLDELREVPKDKRQARFVCEIALSFPDNRLITTRGELAGLIALAPRGTWGFGYDPVFYVPEYQATVAELDLATKNRISHRGEALQKLKEILVARKEEFFAIPPQ
jgi:XTP/dITP diphosphohydrolase